MCSQATRRPPAPRIPLPTDPAELADHFALDSDPIASAVQLAAVADEVGDPLWRDRTHAAWRILQLRGYASRHHIADAGK